MASNDEIFSTVTRFRNRYGLLFKIIIAIVCCTMLPYACIFLAKGDSIAACMLIVAVAFLLCCAAIAIIPKTKAVQKLMLKENCFRSGCRKDATEEKIFSLMKDTALASLGKPILENINGGHQIVWGPNDFGIGVRTYKKRGLFGNFFITETFLDPAKEIDAGEEYVRVADPEIAGENRSAIAESVGNYLVSSSMHEEDGNSLTATCADMVDDARGLCEDPQDPKNILCYENLALHAAHLIHGIYLAGEPKRIMREEFVRKESSSLLFRFFQFMTALSEKKLTGPFVILASCLIFFGCLEILSWIFYLLGPDATTDQLTAPVLVFGLPVLLAPVGFLYGILRTFVDWLCSPGFKNRKDDDPETDA